MLQLPIAKRASSLVLVPLALVLVVCRATIIIGYCTGLVAVLAVVPTFRYMMMMMIIMICT